MRKESQGFALLVIFLPIIVISIIGLAAWIVFDLRKTSVPVSSSAVKSNGSLKDQNKILIQAPKPKDIFGIQNLAGADKSSWTEFVYSDFFYSFKYPTNWRIKNFGVINSTQIGSKAGTAVQRITSPNGNHDRDYQGYESSEGGYDGAQITVSNSYDPDKPRVTTTECTKDFSDYFFVKQLTSPNVNKHLAKCLFHYSDKYYSYQFNAGVQQFNIMLHLGDKSSQQERLEALRIFISVGESLQYYNRNL